MIGTQWYIRGNLGELAFPLRRIQDPQDWEPLIARIDLSDLLRFGFPELPPSSSKTPNYSHWIDGTTITTSLTCGSTSLTGGKSRRTAS